ncbi:MAG: ABC transporter ATP-binding protein [Desulfotignum sp.]|nr:ABC transporter ATP-binding protein [Desulfotignum sp.]MCF8126775.1 ABC transporter ATP-binding protein [Desulfotignum sp.]
MDICLEHINFFHGNTQILSDVTCRFSAGKFYAILGPNGSGKTTLLDLICGFQTPEKGRILLGNTPVKALSRKKVAQAISLVSQSYEVSFPFQVKEVVMMGRHPHIDRFSRPSQDDRNRVAQAMDMTGTAHLANRHITKLSGGEKQRCVFARALCQDTPVLLLDEAFSNMDIHHSFHLLGLVKKAVHEKNKTVIAVLHDINLAAGFSHEILFLKQGRIAAMGDTQNVLTKKNIELVFNVTSKVEYNDYVQAKQVYFKPL